MRDFLAGVTLLACLVIFAVSIVALVKPLPKIWLGSRRKALGGLGVASGLFVLTAIIIPAPDTSKSSSNDGSPKAASATVPSKADKKPEPTLPFTPGEFASRFNELAAEADKPWRISEFSVDGESIKYMLSDHLGFVGNIGTDGRVKGLMVLGTGDGSLGSGVDVFILFATSYCAATDSGDLKRCGPPVMKLMQDFKDGGEPTRTIINNMKLSFTRSDVMGTILTFDPT